jgi:hypothetical protein
MVRTRAHKPKRPASQEGHMTRPPGTAASGPRGSILDVQRSAGNQAVSRSLAKGHAARLPEGLEGMAVSGVESAEEREAGRLERGEDVRPGGAGPSSGMRSARHSDALREQLGSGQPLPESRRAAFKARFGTDAENVRVHTGEEATGLAESLGAQAFTLGSDIVIGEEVSSMQSAEGAGLLAHELGHVAQQHGTTGVSASPSTIYRKTKGEEMVDRADVWLSTNDKLKAEVDVLKAALAEAKKGKSVEFNKKEGVKRVDKAAAALGLKAPYIKSLKADWEWLVDNRKNHATKAYRAKQDAFFNAMKSPLKKLSASNPKAHTEYWLRNTPPQVVDVIYDVADAKMPADQLYLYAASEGLIDVYVRGQIGLSDTAVPTKPQLATVDTNKSLSGFAVLGTDDFMTDMAAKREPLTKYLPSGFDKSKATEIKRTNEKGREVRSAQFSDLKTGLQGMSAMLKRRRALFLEDAKANGYGTPTEEEIIFWTYLYYNPGEFAGKEQLTKYKGKRKLSDWITKGEYPKALMRVHSYRMLKAMKLF